MYQDVVDLHSFYESQIGASAQRILSAHLREIWPSMSAYALVGLGYSLPYLEQWKNNAERTLCFMPEAQGAMHWPDSAKNAAALIRDYQLPLPDSSVDRILIAHCLEGTSYPRDVLNEAWRVLTPNGQIIVIVPNRVGIWARLETTPFGYGRPFTKSQLGQLFKQTSFTPISWKKALFRPPVTSRFLPGSPETWERMSNWIKPSLNGVIISLATKTTDQGIPAIRKQKTARILKPALVPQFRKQTHKNQKIHSQHER